MTASISVGDILPPSEKDVNLSISPNFITHFYKEVVGNS